MGGVTRSEVELEEATSGRSDVSGVSAVHQVVNAALPAVNQVVNDFARLPEDVESLEQFYFLRSTVLGLPFDLQ